MGSEDRSPASWSRRRQSEAAPRLLPRRQIDPLPALAGASDRLFWARDTDLAVRFNINDFHQDICATAWLLGMTEEVINVSVVGHQITVKGKRQPISNDERDDEARQYHLVQRSLTWPCGIDAVTANVRGGVLTLGIPKSAGGTGTRKMIKSLRSA